MTCEQGIQMYYNEGPPKDQAESLPDHHVQQLQIHVLRALHQLWLLGNILHARLLLGLRPKTGSNTACTSSIPFSIECLLRCSFRMFRTCRRLLPNNRWGAIGLLLSSP